MSEDLYAVLESARGATEAELKSAYRRLARQYHPDVNKAPDAEAKFKKVQKAYAILSDPQKRAQYDQYGVADDSPGGHGGPGFEGGFSSESFEDIFDAFFGGGRRQQSGPRRGEDLRYDLEISLEESFKGVSKKVSIYHLEHCSRCEGSGSQPGTAKSSCSHCHGTGQIKAVQRTLLGSFSQVMTCHHCQGTGQMIKNPCLLCHGKGLEKKQKSITVDIPAGVGSGTKVRVTGEGNYGESGGPAGDLYIFLSVKSHAHFAREEDDLHLHVDVPFTQAILGTELTVPTLDKPAIVKIPAGTQSETVFRLKGKGMPHLRGFGHGDLFVKVSVAVPHKVSGKEKQLLEELAEMRGDKSKSTEPVLRRQTRH